MRGIRNKQIKCRKCAVVKPITAFYRRIDKRNKKRIRVYYYECRECRKKITKDYYFNNPNKVYKDYAHYQKALSVTTKRRYASYKCKSKGRGWTFNLDFLTFKKLVNLPCHYCGETKIIRGLDRVDSSKGYINGNVLSCCPKCNTAKNDMSYEDFLNHCFKITIIQKAKLDFEENQRENI